MKKGLTVLATMALCVTIGGVYATWTYAQSTATASEETELSLTIEGSNTSKGTIEVSKSDDFKLEVVDGGSYNTKLEITGTLNVTFTPSTVVEKDKAESTILLQYELKVTQDWTYGDENDAIVTVANAPIQVGTVAADNWSVGSDDLKENIILTEFTLATYAEFEKYEEALSKGKITITFSEYEKVA